jgi:hypothetical protein
VNIESLRASVEDQLRQFGADYNSLDLRKKVLRLADLLISTRKLNVSVVRDAGCNAVGARDRLRIYLTQYVGIVIDGVELEVVSGISEYARRIRELRVQDGYKIITGAVRDSLEHLDLRPNQYLLTRAEPDLTAAHRWHVANRIRRTKGTSAKDRLLEYFKVNVGIIVTSDELAYVAGSAKEFGRRTRELRTEEGYLVATRFTGRPDLSSGEYVLESVERIAEAHDRHISKETQEAVYERDKNQCQLCGWDRSLWSREDPRFLELHHLIMHQKRGANIEANLRVLCNVCHDDVHAGRIVC